MGYRSQVVLAVSKELMPHFLSVMAKCPEARKLVFTHNDELDQNYEGEGHFFVRWDEVKWYQDSYDDVAAIQNFVEEADSDSFELGEDHGGSSENFRFVRTGEESDDVACFGCGFEHIYPYTNISW